MSAITFDGSKLTNVFIKENDSDKVAVGGVLYQID